MDAITRTNLAKSDPEQRMLEDFAARHTRQSIRMVDAAGKAQQKMLVDGLAGRYAECVTEKSGALIRYDILQGLRNLYDEVQDESIREKALELIETEQDPKHRKKYAGVWRTRQLS